jgi:hypothetical protein
MASCQTFVTNEGTNNRVTASIGVMTMLSKPMATVGRPRPTTPFTRPAIRNVTVIVTRMVLVWEPRIAIRFSMQLFCARRQRAKMWNKLSVPSG